MNLYNVRFTTSLGGSLEVSVKAESDASARKFVIEKFSNLFKDIVYSTELPLTGGENDQNIPKDHLIIEL